MKPNLLHFVFLLAPAAAAAACSTAYDGNGEPAGGPPAPASSSPPAPVIPDRDAGTTTDAGVTLGHVVDGLQGPFLVQPTSPCPVVEGHLSIAPSTKGVALAIGYQTSAATTVLRIDIDKKFVAEVRHVPGVATAPHVCLPKWARARGSAAPLDVRVVTAPPGATGACDGSLGGNVESATLVEDPSCIGEEDLRDGSFNAPPTARVRYWRLYATSNPLINVIPPGRTNSTGDQTLFLNTGGAAGSSADAHQWVTVPASSSTGGPAIKYWYRLSGTVSDVVFSDSLLPQQPNLPIVAEWTETTRCLSPSLAGTALLLDYVLAPTGPNPNGQFWVDDVRVTTDQTCPR